MLNLEQLAELLKQRNGIDREMSTLIGRPPHSQHIAEYVAAAVFDIDLHASAVMKAHDGVLQTGPLAGQTVNVKYGSRRDGTLDLVESLDPSNHPDVYLVLTGPTVGAISSRGVAADWVIHAVYLFPARNLLATLASRNMHPGTATSIRRDLWDAAMIYPEARNTQWQLSKRQRDYLSISKGDESETVGRGRDPLPGNR
jgi:hypothetical protein